MWLITKHGMFSVVRSSLNNEMLIRARDEQHLVTLRDEFPELLAGHKIYRNVGTDYPCRLVVSQTEWFGLMGLLAQEATEYTNFKDAAYDSGISPTYDRFLHELWELARTRLQPLSSLFSY